MFLADQRFKFSFPAALTRDGLEHFEIMEALMNEPVWLLHATERSSQGTIMSRRRIFVHEPSLAVELLRLPQWSAKRLYVLLPEYITGLPKLSFHACDELWECEEPHNETPCWRLRTGQGEFLCSPFNTPLGEEINPRLIWRDDDAERAI